MTRLPLICVTCAIAALAVSGCNRTETKQEAQQVAAGARTVAARAGDKFADSWLTTKIQAKYFADRTVKGRYINVDTRDGVVTLSGYVENPALRTQAEQIARSTDGVRTVVDQLLVGHAPPGYAPPAAAGAVATTGSGDNAGADVARADDASITSGVQARYFVDASLKVREIEVDTRSGVVTLHGEVASESERSQALTLARTAPGVQRVEDNLTVNAAAGAILDSGRAPAAAGATATAPAAPHLDDSAVTAALKSKLAAANAQAVNVSARDGVVVLEGSVSDSGARNRIIDLVRQSEGVVQVVDRMKVGPRK